jgi:hypothetical protein
MHKNTENISTVSSRRLEKACQYVSDLWFPVNSELLAKLKMGVKGGVYDLNPEELVTGITSDFSLYMYCLRELLNLLKQEGAKIPPLSNPVEVLRQAGIEKLKSILSVEEHQISKHNFESIDEFQSLRLGESLISASAVSVMSESSKKDQETGYSAALLRQLGLTLIAWNYPSIYKDALSNITEFASLDLLITEKLGFSPTLLAIRLLVSWGVPIAYCEAVFMMDDQEETNEEESINNILSGSLAKICQVGEALARANNPKVYPTAEKDWEMAKSEIESRLGKDGIQLIQDALNDNIENYLTFMPELFNGGLVLDPELHNAEKQRSVVGSRNPYVILCKESLKNQLTHLYLNMPEGVISENSLADLIRNIIPTSDFTGGYIYSIDPGISMLVPQTKFGTVLLKEAKMVDYSLVTSNGDSVSVAFRSNDPVVEYGLTRSKEYLTGITGILGYSSRVGVLYLEIPQALYGDGERTYLHAFKAISQTINDCLNLK